MEPSKHQYDFDVAAVVSFLKHYELEKDLNLPAPDPFRFGADKLVDALASIT